MVAVVVVRVVKVVKGMAGVVKLMGKLMVKVMVMVKVRGVATTMEEVTVQSEAPKTATSMRLKKATVISKNLEVVAVVEEKVEGVAVVAVVAVKAKEAKEGTVEVEV